MQPYKHQEEFAEKLWQILKVKGYVYLAGKPRSGKTYTSILTAEKSDKIKSVIVLTKKAAIPGWMKFLDGNESLKHNYTVTNYEQIGTFDKLKFRPEDYQLAIIDESHNIGAFPKPSGRYKAIRKLCANIPHIHLSGTAMVESQASIYHQMTISKYSPFKHRNFYDFHREFGEPYYIMAGGRQINQYDKTKDSLMPIINDFTVYMTQEDAGIDKSLQAIDKLHMVELKQSTVKLYNKLQEDQIITLTLDSETGEEVTIVADTVMKLRTSLHMLESGIVKDGDKYIDIGNNEKVDYIMKEFGDNEDTGIMCHFVGERIKLEKAFKKAKIYSSSSHAEGVDLSHLKNFVILSSDYSGAKFIQRRDRIINTNGSNTLTVHHILVKSAISEQVYKRVSKKEDFNNSTYEAVAL
jgi:hypothetical protein